MLVNLLVWLALASLAVFLGCLAARARRARSLFVRVPGVLLSGLLALLVALIVGVGAVGLYKLYIPAPRPVQASAPGEIQATPEMIQRGEHIASVFCISCHSTNDALPLTGGVDLSGEIPLPVGSLISPNLTPAGLLKDYSDEDIWRVLREGTGPDGTRRFVMGLTYSRYLSDDDLRALIAYLRSQPPVENETPRPADRFNFLGVLLVGSGLIADLPPVAGPVVAPPKAATAQYGEYILSYQDCRSCHGADLLGGEGALGPAGPGLRAVRGLSNEQFIHMMRTGARPDGHQLQPPMPWKAIGRMDDTELSAMYQYLLTIP